MTVSVILDTDFATDIDDCGALAVLHALADLGECTILGVLVNSTNTATPNAIDAVNRWWGRPNIPIGVYSTSGNGGNYPAAIQAQFPHRIQGPTDCQSALTVYRTLLAAAPASSVTIVSVGFMSNLAALLNSPADGISSLTGMQLVTAKVARMVCMGGDYPSGNEFNFLGDKASAVTAVNNWPVAATWCGSSVTGAVQAGAGLAALDPWNPVRYGYQQFLGTIRDYSCYDLCAAYEAVRPNDGTFGYVTSGHNTVAADGTNAWAAGGTTQAYLTQANAAAASAKISALLTSLPKNTGVVGNRTHRQRVGTATTYYRRYVNRAGAAARFG